MAAPNDRARTLVVGLAIIGVVASLAAYFAWRAGEDAKSIAPPPAGASAR